MLSVTCLSWRHELKEDGLAYLNGGLFCLNMIRLRISTYLQCCLLRSLSLAQIRTDIRSAGVIDTRAGCIYSLGRFWTIESVDFPNGNQAFVIAGD